MGRHGERLKQTFVVLCVQILCESEWPADDANLQLDAPIALSTFTLLH